MLLLLDIGNTHTHIGLANERRVLRQWNLRTRDWFEGRAAKALRARVGAARLDGAALCSVVPKAVAPARRALRELWNLRCVVLAPGNVLGIGIDYPRPRTIGPDRLANAIAARHRFGAPVVVVDFGTAVTFDVVSRRGDYVGGIIAPGLAAMTDYLHEKTALLPRIKIRDTSAVIGRSTREAMRIGAVHGYRGLVRELIGELRRELGSRNLPVVATGGCAKLIAAGLPEIAGVDPNLTLEGLRLVWQSQSSRALRRRPPKRASA